MTTLDLALAGLPEMPPIPFMEAVEALGWQCSGLIEPGPRDVCFAYSVPRRAFALVVDIDPRATPPAFTLVEGSAQTLVDWMEEHRPELCVPTNTPVSPWETLRRYADDLDQELAWWELCDDDARYQLVVDLGDA